MDDKEEEVVRLDPASRQDYNLESLLSMEKKGKLDLRPFFQRGFKWKLKQSSLWIESILLEYPCPEIILIRTQDGFGVLDGGQRLTSLCYFVNNTMAPSWRGGGSGSDFHLKDLALLKVHEGKSFRQLGDKIQQKILTDFAIRCTIIPDTWPLSNIIDFFKRIQGGGTPMSDQELRRVMARGSFTDLLDSLASEMRLPFSSLYESLERGGVRMDPDEYEELYLRFFSLQYFNPSDFGTPSIQQQGLRTMRDLNRLSLSREGEKRVEEMVSRLKCGVEVSLYVFVDPNTLFRRAMPLEEGQQRVWSTSARINKHIWDCFLHVFSRPELKGGITSNAEEVKEGLIHLMQKSSSFSSKSLSKVDTSERIREVEGVVDLILSTPDVDRPISGALRREMLSEARMRGRRCSICDQSLLHSIDLFHVEHVIPTSKGGKTTLDNLSVSHKFCTLNRGSTVPK